MKKFTRRMLSVVMAAFMAVSGMSAVAVSAADYYAYQSNAHMREKPVMPREAIPSGYYDSVLDYRSYIYTYVEGLDTKCIARVIIATPDGETKRFVTGEGRYDYNIGTGSFDIYLTSWHYDGQSGVHNTKLTIRGTYENGTIITEFNEVFRYQS